MHDLIAARLQFREQHRQRLGGGGLNVMHQNDAFSSFLELRHHTFHQLLRIVQFEVEAVDVGRENSNVAAAEMSKALFRILQERVAKERRHGATERAAHPADWHATKYECQWYGPALRLRE